MKRASRVNQSRRVLTLERAFIMATRGRQTLSIFSLCLALRCLGGRQGCKSVMIPLELWCIMAFILEIK